MVAASAREGCEASLDKFYTSTGLPAMSRQIGFQISVRGAGDRSVFDFALPLV